MRFNTDDQRRAAFARMRGRNAVSFHNAVDVCKEKKGFLKPTKRDMIYRIDDGCAIRLWDTDIAVADAKTGTITLDSGGYQTTTTKDRLNRFLNPIGYRVYQKKGEWFIDNPTGQTSKFVDGMKIPAGSKKLSELSGMKASSEAPIGGYRHQTDAWRGYNVPTNAVAGSSDTGTWSDSPCPTPEVTKEITELKTELGRAGIRTEDKVTSTSNLFCGKRWVVLKKASDFEKAKPIIKRVIEKSSYLHDAEK